MAGKLFVLQKVEHFAPGFFENTAITDSYVQLTRKSGRFVQTGSYITTPFAADDFFGLLPSWNAHAPKGTSIEVQARVLSAGKWSAWLSFGQWSPHMQRAANQSTGDDIAMFNGQALALVPGCQAANMAQMRVIFYSDDGGASPRLYLLGFCTNATERAETQPQAYERTLAAPAYSCMVRELPLAGHIASATALCMMLNRYGCDLLPEEVAHLAYDYALQSYGRLSFLCAVVGAYGFRSYLAYASIALLRSEVWQGRPALARVHYRAPNGEENQTGDFEEDHTLSPIWQNAVAGSDGHLVVVHGFSFEDGVEMVLIHDALAQSNSEVSRSIPMATFAKIYSGIAMIMQKAPKNESRVFPERQAAQIKIHGGKLRLYCGEEELALPLADAPQPKDTFCYTISSNVAYASAAQSKFYYQLPDETGAITVSEDDVVGRRLTCYLIGRAGDVWVAEHQF